MNETKILLIGACGKMGYAVAKRAEFRDDCKIIAGIDLNPIPLSFPVYKSINDYYESADVVLDFSNPSSLESRLKYADKTCCPVVLATTGFSSAQKDLIKNAAQKIPIFCAANMSLGINLILKFVKNLAETLIDGFDVEIIEKHHASKADAPSGTALLIAEAIIGVSDIDMTYVCNHDGERDKGTIGIHSVRGGNLPGEHEVIFAGCDEVIKISHKALDRSIYANGALDAVAFIRDKPAGLYTMENLID